MNKIEDIPIHFALEGWIHYLLSIGKLSKEDLDKIVFLPISSFFRNYSSEIHAQDNSKGGNQDGFPYRLSPDNDNFRLIWLNRDGFYHKLPYFLFHEFNTSGGSETLDLKIEKERKELINAMKHLFPLDNEFILQRILLFHEVKTHAAQNLQGLFAKIFAWKIEKINLEFGFELKEIPQIFFSLLQFKDRIAQDNVAFLEGFKLVITDFYVGLFRNEHPTSTLSKNDVNSDIEFSLQLIKYNDFVNRFYEHDQYRFDLPDYESFRPQSLILPAPVLLHTRLGECKLGVNATCGIPYPDEFYFEFAVAIKSRKAIELFVNSTSRAKMEMMAEMYCSFFAPLNQRLLHPFKVKVEEAVPATLGGSKANSYSNILGYGVTLPKSAINKINAKP